MATIFPGSLNNKYKSQINKHRKALRNWQNKINDIGHLSEKDHLESMWPKGIQPITKKPHITIRDQLVIIKSKTKGASNAYIFSDKNFVPN